MFILVSALVVGASPASAQYNNEQNYGGGNYNYDNSAPSNGNQRFDEEINNYNYSEFDTSSNADGINYEQNEVDLSEDSAQRAEGEAFPHPTAANHWRTQELLFTNPLPKLETITECRDELAALGEKAINAEMVMASRSIINQAVVRKPAAYHWCFYYSAWRLENDLNDMALDRDYNEKNAFFVAKMKELWILARALDAALGSKKYFGFARRRYIDMAANHFGRRLEPISPPLGDRGQSAMQLLTRPATPLFRDN